MALPPFIHSLWRKRATGFLCHAMEEETSWARKPKGWNEFIAIWVSPIYTHNIDKLIKITSMKFGFLRFAINSRNKLQLIKKKKV